MEARDVSMGRYYNMAHEICHKYQDDTNRNNLAEIERMYRIVVIQDNNM